MSSPSFLRVVLSSALAGAVSRKSDEQVGRAVREVSGPYVDFVDIWNGIRPALSGLSAPYPPLGRPVSRPSAVLAGQAKMQAGIPGGFQAPPQEIAIDVYNLAP